MYFINLAILLFISLISYSQIAINNDNNLPDSSAMLDVQSTSQGLLLPRLSSTQRDAIQYPANGLMIYNTDTKILEAFGGNTWTNLNGIKTSDVICGLSTVDFGGIKYGTVKYNGRCWLDRNIGAKQVPDAIDDSLGFGYYYQWGREGDGHQHPLNDTTYSVSINSTPGHSLFILPTSSPFDWQDPQNADLWNLHDYNNNPCPEGWTVPSLTEWNEAVLTWSNSTDAFSSLLKLPTAGYRSHVDGEFVTNLGGYWTSSMNGSGSEIIYFDNTTVSNLNKYRARGFSVRCIEVVADKPVSHFSLAYGGIDNEFANSIDQTSDGDFIIAGKTESYGSGSGDFLLLRVDTIGSFEMGKAYGTASSEECYSVVATTDNGFILTGESGSDVYNIKLNSQGAVDWDEVTGYGGNETNRDVIQDSDGGFVFVGYTDGFGAGGIDNLVTKRDISGNNVWGWAIGDTGNEYGYGIIKDTDGGYAICGASNSNSAGGYDFRFTKLNTDGTSQYGWNMGGTENEYARALTLTHDLGYVMVGYTYSFGASDADFYIRKVNANGTTGWGSVLGGTEEDIAFSVVLTEDGGFAIAGQTKSFGAGLSDMWLVKLDSDGNFVWSWVFGGSDHDYGRSIIVGEDGCYYVVGSTKSYGVGSSTDKYDALLVKFAPDGSTCLGYFLGLPTDSDNMTFVSDDIFTATPISEVFFQHTSGDEKPVKMKITKAPSIGNGSRSVSITTNITPTVTIICEDE